MKAEEFYNAVKILIQENRKTYSDSPKRIISDYNHEVESTKEYNGRQILELLQNADDADSDAVHISFDKEQNKLSIANKGEHPFTVGGIESLMLANLSTKTSKIYIGNKGLGFRSILDWADKIVIKTNGCLVEFSPAIAKEEFELAVKTNLEKKALLSERGLAETTIPFPILAIPRITIDEFLNNEWTTVIEIFYKQKFEKSIQLQLEDCREEILLFLNNIERITIDELGKENIEYKRIKIQENNLTYIQIKEKIWRIETMEDLLPDALQDKSKIEVESYKITVAFQDDLSDNYYKLFNYFPTKLSIYLPCIIHATFELNSSRDYINSSLKNEFIFEQLVELLKECSLNLVNETDGRADWKPFKLILPLQSTTDSKLISLFYANLKKSHELLKIFPCINGSYEMLDKVKYYEKNFSEWVKSNGFSNHFKELLIPEEESISVSFPIGEKRYVPSEFITIIDAVSLEINDLKIRAEFISLLLQISISQNSVQRYSILVNKEDVVIDKKNVAFTPIIESEAEFKRPDFIYLDFINKELYNILAAKYKNNFKQGEPESREFQRLFSRIANIQPYDSNAVISKIISGTRDIIKTAPNDSAIVYVKEMVQALFDTYRMLKYKTERFTESSPLLNKKNEIKDSRLLFLSGSFPTGRLTEKIFESVLSDEDYLKDIEFYELDNSNNELIESFFIWLGANKYVQFNNVTIAKEAWDSVPYLDYVFTYIKKPTYVTRYTYSGKEIGLLSNTVAKLSNEKLVMLVFKDERIHNAVLGLSETGHLYYQYGNNYPTISGNKSYITFQLRSLRRFDNYLIENNEIPFINDLKFNYDDPLLKEYKVSYSDINYILEKLGALRSFIDLSTERVYKLIKQCGELQADHKHARRLYLQAFEHFRSPKMNSFLSIMPDTVLLATRNGKKDYRPVEEVYYTDNYTLPEKIIQDLWIFDFPKRAGEVQVSKYFKIKTLHELQISVDVSSIIEHSQNAQFNEWINKIKPLILAYRLSSLKDKKDKRDAALAIKRCKIRLISDVKYTIDGQNYQKLGYDEFIINDDQFLFSAEHYKKLEQFKDSSKFCSAFAEMMCILFKVNEHKNNYITVFKDKIGFSKELIKSDSLDEYLDDAYSLLGLSQNETGFWEAICKIKNIQLLDNIQEEQLLREFLKQYLNYDLPDDYKQVDFDKYGTLSSFNLLKSILTKLGISLNEIKAQFESFPGIMDWHISRITDISRDIENTYSNTIWDSLKLKDVSEQQTFISKRNKFREWFNNCEWSELELPSLTLELNYKEILVRKVTNELSIELSDNVNPIIIQQEYKELLKKYEEKEKSFTDEQRSLLYFTGHYDDILVILSGATTENVIETEGRSIENTILPVIEKELTSNLPTPIRGKNSWGNGAVDPNREKLRRRAGKNAELKVRDTLVQLYGRKNVQWVSGNSDEDKPNDSLGYDFLYRKKETDEWCFLEVKSVTGTSFIISNNEFNVAFKNKDKYHLAVVKLDSIIIDKEFFKNSDLENAYNTINSNIFMRPCDFEVFYS